MTERVPFVVQYFPRAEKLRYVLCSLQHVIDDNECLAKAISMLPFLAFKQPPNLKETIICSKLPSLQENSDRNTRQHRHGNLCKTCQIIDMGITITHGNATHHRKRTTGMVQRFLFLSDVQDVEATCKKASSLAKKFTPSIAK
eukprot:g45738.t1